MKAGTDPVSVFLRQQLLQALETRFSAAQINLRSWRVADVGCGYGYWLQNLVVSINLPSCQVFGIDHDLVRLRDHSARPNASNVVCGDARQLPWPAESFDLVTQFTMFSSILNFSERMQIAREIIRVLKPGGMVLWYDFFAPNLRNRKTRAIGKSELRRLFSGCQIEIHRVTLAPPLTRLVLGVSHRLARSLATVPVLCTHYLAFITGPDRTACP